MDGDHIDRIINLSFSFTEVSIIKIVFVSCLTHKNELNYYLQQNVDQTKDCKIRKYYVNQAQVLLFTLLYISEVVCRSFYH